MRCVISEFFSTKFKMDTVERVVTEPIGIDTVDDEVKMKKQRRPHRNKQVTAQSGCDCEYKYRDYTWRKFTDYEPSRHGVEVREFYVVNVSGKELFTYVEGAVGSTRTDVKFPYLCGEIVSAKKMASAGKLKNVYTWVNMTPEQAAAANLVMRGGPDCDTSFCGVTFSDEDPLHVRQRYETNANRTLTGLPLVVDRQCKVVVLRTQGESLFVQLMPTLHSEHKQLIPGTPLFDKSSRSVRAVVGNMFSQNDYVVNCAPVEFCEITTHGNKHGTDRLRVVCLDRRGRRYEDRDDKETAGVSQRRNAGSVLSSLVNMGVEAVMGTNGNSNTSSLADDAVAAAASDDSSDNELLFDGVVNDKFQIVDTYNFDKKNKPPKAVVTITIDDSGVSVHHQSGDKAIVKWVHRDPNVSYSIMPRRFFNAKASVVAINTAVRTAKKEQHMKKYKSLERLI